MSSNNYMQIKELSLESYTVSERDYENGAEIQSLGKFDSLRAALEKAEYHINEVAYGVEYGIRFISTLKDSIDRIKNESSSKDFDNWNINKKNVQEEKSRLYTTREVWWCRLGVNIGSEQDGSGEEFLRPVTIIRGFGANICIIVPLTKSTHKHPLRVQLGNIQDEQASALLSQIRVIDTRRLVEKIGFLDKEIFEKLRKNVRNLF